MKSIFLLLLMGSFFISSAQIYVKPIIGIDFSSINESNNSPEFDVNGSGINASDLLLGVTLERVSSRKSIIFINSTINSKHIKSSIWNVVGYNGIKFYHLRNSIGIKFHSSENFSLSTGLFSSIGLNYSLSKNGKSYKLGNFNDFGLLVGVVYKYKKLDFGLSYFHGTNINFNGISNGILQYSIEPPKSVVLTCCYRFKINLNLNKKNIECPEF